MTQKGFIPKSIRKDGKVREVFGEQKQVVSEKPINSGKPRYGICPTCKKQFRLLRSGNQRFCSKECRPKPKPISCLWCEKELSKVAHVRSRFCDTFCNMNFQNLSLEERLRRIELHRGERSE